MTLPRDVSESRRAGSAGAARIRSAQPQLRARRTATVLVIDDDANVRDLMQRTLAKDGFHVEVAADGSAASNSRKELQPAVITLDVMMPGMDGWAVLTALKADPATADIPVVMLTIVDDKNMGFALGAADYFTKPIDWQRLAAALKKHRRSDGSQTVLIVEDDANTREMLRRSVEKEGWNVREAENGRLGLERLDGEASPHHPARPDDAGDGRLRRSCRNCAKRADCGAVPVIVITAKDLTAEDHAAAQRRGGADHPERRDQRRATARRSARPPRPHCRLAHLMSTASGTTMRTILLGEDNEIEKVGRRLKSLDL